MKTINEINQKIKYNKLIKLINDNYSDLEITVDINDKNLFSVWNDDLNYYLYIGEFNNFLYYIELSESVNKLQKNMKFELSNFIYKTPKQNKINQTSFWENLINRRKFSFLLYSRRVF